jgi:LDH2 family malate/lactate/ureidoglycolate dehydrogenase
MKVQADRLNEIAIHILKGLNTAEEEAAVVAEALIKAELRGIDTHGVHLLTLLPERVEAGMLEIPTKLTVLKESGATALLDGGNGLGQAAAHRAMGISIRKAKEFGIGCCLVRNTNNIGMLSVYTLMAAQQKTVGIVMGNAAAAMSPWGGTEPFFGTNPLSIAVPGEAGAPPVVLDLSSTGVGVRRGRDADRRSGGGAQGDADADRRTQRLRSGADDRCPGRHAFGVSVRAGDPDLPPARRSHGRRRLHAGRRD